MPAQEIAFRRDKILYWEKATPDRHGVRKVLPYVELRVRWDDKKTLGRDSQGNKISLDSTVIAAQNLLPQSIVLHQTEEYYVGTGSDLTPLELYEVVTMDQTPDIKNRASAYVVGLQRYRGNLPEVVS